jgi:hypothetical protein
VLCTVPLFLLRPRWLDSSDIDGGIYRAVLVLFFNVAHGIFIANVRHDCYDGLGSALCNSFG